MKSETVKLEGLIDSTTLASVVEALSEIAYAKAEHLESNWQDANAAREWRIAGEVLIKLATRKEIKGL